MSINTLCVYCGSKAGHDSGYARAAASFGEAMAAQKINLVYGGACVGLMGQVADAVLAGGGHVTGVIPGGLFKNEVAHPRLSELVEVEGMHRRKQVMAHRADGFVALPGGFGTLEEVLEAITWNQIGIHKKPAGLLNVNGFYDGLDLFLQQVSRQGFIKPEHLRLYCIDSDPCALLNRMNSLHTH